MIIRMSPSSFLTGILKLYGKLWPSKYPIPPYDHVCQIGDPILRLKTKSVDVNEITSKKIKKIIEKMIKVLRKYDLVGLAAPQIGCNHRIFIVEMTDHEIKKYHPNDAKAKEIETFPLQVFINPVLNVTNNHIVRFSEGCESIKEYSAIIPRFYEVKIKAFDENGKEFEMRKKGWIARIFQHEMDHLNGQLYVDIMDPHTYQFNLWEKVNYERGRLWKKLGY